MEIVRNNDDDHHDKCNDDCVDYDDEFNDGSDNQ